MLRRTFAKSLLAVCSIPFWPFPTVKEKLSNSDLIKKLLDEGKNFSITCGHSKSLDGTDEPTILVNVIRSKHKKVDFQQAVKDRLNMSEKDKKTQDDNNNRRNNRRNNRHNNRHNNRWKHDNV